MDDSIRSSPQTPRPYKRSRPEGRHDSRANWYFHNICQTFERKHARLLKFIATLISSVIIYLGSALLQDSAMPPVIFSKDCFLWCTCTETEIWCGVWAGLTGGWWNTVLDNSGSCGIAILCPALHPHMRRRSEIGLNWSWCRGALNIKSSSLITAKDTRRVRWAFLARSLSSTLFPSLALIPRAHISKSLTKTVNAKVQHLSKLLPLLDCTLSGL